MCITHRERERVGGTVDGARSVVLVVATPDARPTWVCIMGRDVRARRLGSRLSPDSHRVPRRTHTYSARGARA